MMIDKNKYQKILDELEKAVLVAVSKKKPVEAIKDLYDLGQKDFGENYVQEMVDKQQVLPADINWHFIGHLQTNKVKYIASFVHLIHGVDSFKLLKEINKQAQKQGRVIDVLLQIHIAKEETKFGLDENELADLVKEIKDSEMKSIHVKGLMGMASFTDDENVIRNEFRYLKNLFDKYASLTQDNFDMSLLSMGMSSDYKMALEEGSNMIRIGSLIFGDR